MVISALELGAIAGVYGRDLAGDLPLTSKPLPPEEGDVAHRMPVVGWEPELVYEDGDPFERFDRARLGVDVLFVGSSSPPCTNAW